MTRQLGFSYIAWVLPQQQCWVQCAFVLDWSCILVGFVSGTYAKCAYLSFFMSNGHNVTGTNRQMLRVISRRSAKLVRLSA